MWYLIQTKTFQTSHNSLNTLPSFHQTLLPHNQGISKKGEENPLPAKAWSEKERKNPNITGKPPHKEIIMRIIIIITASIGELHFIVQLNSLN